MKTITIIIIITIIIFIILLRGPSPSQVRLGVSFSPKYAKYLGLDWKKTFIQSLDQLKVKSFRIPTYWDNIEKNEGIYDFSDTDFMLTEAGKRGAKVVLVVGARQPRWPECHYPDWSKKTAAGNRQKKTLELIKKVLERYKNNSSIWAWQVENEPFAWWFGECDKADKVFLQQELNLVKKIDSRPVIFTDSGEWGFWAESLNSADILGISIYKKAYNTPLGIYLTYPFPAVSYNLKGKFINKLFFKDKKIIVSELQAEPWLSMKDPRDSLPENQAKTFSIKEFKDNIDFVRKTGFEEGYLWGIEWWFWMDAKGYPLYLDYAKSLF